MATRTITLNILINGTGTEIPNLLTTDPYELYLIQGTAIAIGNYAIVPTGTPSLGLTYKFKYKASLDITTNSKTFSLFGTSITQEQLNKNWSAECYYNGTSWDIILDMDFSEAGIISSNNLQANIINSTALANGSVTTPKLANLAVTDAKLASDAVTTSKILDANVTTAKIADDAITTVKVLDANITTPKINDLAVTTNKLANDSVTNSKLGTMTASSIKIGDASGNPQDLSIGLDEIPIGNGTTITTINKSSLLYSGGWNLSGNTGTTPGTDFLGTTDSKDLVFKVGSLESGRINISDGNTSFGRLSLYVNTGFSNTAFGSQSLQNNISGARNTSVGTSSLSGVSTGTDNIGIGLSAGSNITTGDNNTIIGSSANVDSINASSRIALGSGAIATEDYQFAIPNDVIKIKWRGVSYSLPATDGTAGQKLTTDGSGNLSWT